MREIQKENSEDEAMETNIKEFYFKFQDGQGVGNQLWCYLSLKSIFHDRKEELFFIGYEDFKVPALFPWHDFKIEFRNDNFITDCIIDESVEFAYSSLLIKEDIVELINNFINSADNERIIELRGVLQKNCYLASNERLRSFLSLDKLDNIIELDNDCVIHIRGGDYLGIPSSLPSSYYKKAINIMKEKYGVKNFKIVTNDFSYAKKILPEYHIVGAAKETGALESTNASHHIGGSIYEDFLVLYSAKHVIMSNSTFALWPVKLSNCNKQIIAPMYWFAYNISNGWWSPEDSIEDDWIYINPKSNSVQKGIDLDYSKFRANNLVFFYYLYKARLKRKVFILMGWTDLK